MRQRVAVDASGCWSWRRSPSNKDGYGRVLVGSRADGTRRQRVAHRVVFEALYGPLPEGLELDHLCRNRACVRPDHLEPVTRQMNLLRGDTIPARKAAQTHCIRGHKLTGENLKRNSSTRKCRVCQQMRDKGRRR